MNLPYQLLRSNAFFNSQDMIDVDLNEIQVEDYLISETSKKHTYEEKEIDPYYIMQEDPYGLFKSNYSALESTQDEDQSTYECGEVD